MSDALNPLRVLFSHLKIYDHRFFLDFGFSKVYMSNSFFQKDIFENTVRSEKLRSKNVHTLHCFQNGNFFIYEPIWPIFFVRLLVTRNIKRRKPHSFWWKIENFLSIFPFFQFFTWQIMAKKYKTLFMEHVILFHRWIGLTIC